MFSFYPNPEAVGFFSKAPNSTSSSGTSFKFCSSLVSLPRIRTQNRTKTSSSLAVNSNSSFLAMALARLASRNQQLRLLTLPSTASLIGRNIGARTRPELGGFQRLMATDSATEKASDDKEVAVSEGGSSRRRRFSLLPRRNRGRTLWRDDDRDFVPALYEFFPSGLGNALMQATDNINRLFDSMNMSPWQLAGRVKEKDDHYKIKYEVPGLTKDDIKITVHDGILTIKGEQKKEDQEGESDDERWSSSSYYGYYFTSLVLPEDAKVDEIKAELKDGVLSIAVPRTENPKREVKEVEVH